jgi:hypothetical protein
VPEIVCVCARVLVCTCVMCGVWIHVHVQGSRGLQLSPVLSSERTLIFLRLVLPAGLRVCW